MKTMKTKYIFSSIFIVSSILSFTLSGCSNSTGCFDKYDDNNIIVIVPAIGCSGCINTTLRYLREHQNSKRLKFVITRYGNDKELRLTIGKKLYNSPNRIEQNDIPKECEWLFKDHPVIFYNGKKDTPEVIMPANASRLLNKLDSFLEKNE
jgi:hypothetical protein